MNRNALKNVSLSHATMRPEDLIPCFIDVIRDIARDESGIILKIDTLEMDMENTEDYYETENADWDLETLFDILDDLAPEGYYFGAHPGDGSDYGFWQVEDYEEE